MIEKNIFQSWNTRDLPKPVQDKIDKFKAMNPDYKYQLYTDEEIDKFVNENYPGEIAEAYNKLNIIVAKVDFWRYLVLYKYGGVYLDIDSNIVKPLNQLIKDEDEAIITSENSRHVNMDRRTTYVCYVQWALIFKKDHPILKRTVDMIVNNIKTNRHPENIHAMTGPTVFSEAVMTIHKELFNKDAPHWAINDKPIDKTFSKNGISYRIFGIMYNGYLDFKDQSHHNILYKDKKHWKEQEKKIPLFKGGRRRKTRNRNRKRKRSLTSTTRRRTSVTRL
jgi:mannosyltransferase OCH1-like enzyme